MISTFIKNRKLKKINALELVPIKLVESETVENELIKLIVPRFNKRWLSKIFIGKYKSEYFKISLDAIGTKAWLLIDNKKNVMELIESFNQLNIIPVEETQDRILAFITELYRKDLITFKQIV